MSKTRARCNRATNADGHPRPPEHERANRCATRMHRAEAFGDSRKLFAAKSAIGQLAITVSRSAATRRVDRSQNLQCGLVSEVNVRVSHKTQSFESPWSRGSCKREGKRGRRFPSGSFRKRKSACIGSFSKQYSTPIARFLPKNTDLKRFFPLRQPR